MSRVAASTLVLSASALIAIAMHEGFRDKAYDDGVGVQTIGFGSTENVKRGDTITVERALVRLGESADRIQRDLHGCVGETPMLQREWDAIASWAYNVGGSAACKSTLVKKLKAGDYTGACAELLRWNRAGGRELRGLTLRRQAEYRQCMGQ